MKSLVIEKKLKVSNCMLCFSKKEELKNHPRVTRGMGNRNSSVLFLTHQPKPGCCKPEFNRPLTSREISLIDNSLAPYGASILDYYTMNVVKCSSDSITLPMYRNCSETHTKHIVESEGFTHVIGLGAQVAKYVFSRGKAPPSMNVLCGTPVKQFDLPGKTLFFTYHPDNVISLERDDPEKYYEAMESFNKSIRALGAFLKEEQLI